MAIPLAALATLGSAAGGGGGGGFLSLLGPLGSLLGGLKGGGKTQVSTSLSTSLSAAVNPNIIVSLGGGQINPFSSGSATSSGSSPISASQDDTPFGSPLGLFPDTGRIDLATAGAGEGGPLAGLFADPFIMLLLLGGGVMLFMSSGKG